MNRNLPSSQMSAAKIPLDSMRCTLRRRWDEYGAHSQGEFWHVGHALVVRLSQDELSWQVAKKDLFP